MNIYKNNTSSLIFLNTPLYFLTAVLAFCGLIWNAAYAQTLMQRNMSLALAEKLIDAAIAECSEPGEVTISVAVVDAAGQPVMQIRDDTASPHNWELVYRKAYTARTFRRTSLDWRDRTAGESDRAGQRLLSTVIPLGGGAPVMLDGQPIGAIGVSGSTGGQPADSACAEAAVASIEDDLK